MPTKSRLEWARTARKCPNHPDIPGYNGRLQCKQCLDASKVRTLAHKAKTNKLGVCPGHPEVSLQEGYSMCFSCLWTKRARHLKKMFKITIEDYARMEHFQNRKCGICEIFNDNLCVDHDHATGLIRQLLCHQCNTALGLFKDNSKFLISAANYVDFYKELAGKK